MRIATATLNPAIDQTVRVDNFQPDTVNRSQMMQFDAGGKGVNVASFLADAGYDVTVTGFLGQDNAETFRQFFTRKGIDDQFVYVPGRTRIGIKIVDEAQNQTTDINQPGLTPPDGAIETLFRTIERLIPSCDWFVLSGTVPPGVPSTIYATIIERLRKQGKQVALDTSGDALQKGILAGPTIAKPNIDELRQLVGHALHNEAAIEQAARQLLDNGISTVVVSMGERGAMVVEQDTTLLALPLTVPVKSTVGAGDAMVAGLIAGKIQGLNLADCARLATAFAAGTITQIGSHLPEAAIVQAYFQQVPVHIWPDVPDSVFS